jgi:hypothetical protein
LIRGKTHLEVYQIKGKSNTSEMKDFLNEMFLDKGLEFLDIIVTEVLLPNEIMGPLDRKAQYASLNEMEREKYNYQMRLIDDDETLQLLKQRKTEQRDSLNEEFSKKITLTSRELSIVKANTLKSVAEIKATASADQY